MNGLFKYLPVAFCTVRFSVVPELPAAPFFPSNAIPALWSVPSSIHPGRQASQSARCLLAWVAASSSRTAPSGATQGSHPRTTRLQLVLWVSGMTCISEYFHSSANAACWCNDWWDKAVPKLGLLYQQRKTCILLAPFPNTFSCISAKLGFYFSRISTLT